MNKIVKVFSIVAALVVSITLVGCLKQTTSQTASPTTQTAAAVIIQGFAFNPPTLTVKSGTTVTWTNQDTVLHSVKFASFASADLAPNETFQHTFDQPGTYQYSCSIHPTMQGTIIVQ